MYEFCTWTGLSVASKYSAMFFFCVNEHVMFVLLNTNLSHFNIISTSCSGS